MRKDWIKLACSAAGVNGVSYLNCEHYSSVKK